MKHALIAAFLWLVPALALAQSIPAPLSDTVNDYADLLPPEDEAALAAHLQAAREETGVHVVLVTTRSQADHDAGGMAIESFGKAWFNAWGIGDPQRNDGILILVIRDDRVMRIALGAGYDTIWDGRAQRVIDRGFLPDFRAEDYRAGIATGTGLVIEHLARPFAASTTPPEDDFSRDRADTVGAVVSILLFGLFALGVVALTLRHRLADWWAARGTCPRCGGRHLSVRRKVTKAATRTREGAVERRKACSGCGWAEVTPYALPSKGSSGSGSSGFGGGSSSGGGATGRW